MAVFSIAAGYVTDSTLAVVFMMLGTGLSGTTDGGGFLVNYLDIAPAFAGILLGIANTVATLSGIFSGTLIGFITQHHVREL